MRTGATTVLLLALMTAGPRAHAEAEDPCIAAVPSKLRALLLQKFPGHRLPVDAEVDAEERQSYGAAGCFKVAHGDYNGDGEADLAVLLPGVAKERVILAVALRKRDSWEVASLPTWCDSAAWCYVRTKHPGTYERTEALDSPLEKGESSKLTSEWESVVSGTLEATSVVHVYTAKGWRYVWTGT